MERDDREKHSQTENEMRMNLIGYLGDLSKAHVIINALQKKKKTLTRKL